MNSTAKRFGIAVACALLVVGVLWMGDARVEARGTAPTYCSQNDHVFWFVHMSDLHIGASGAADRLRRFLDDVRSIGPLFTVATGDLTDSTNGNIFGYPNGPYTAEWQLYRTILDAGGMNTTNYYDIPGNHDEYNDGQFVYYKKWGMQGAAFASTGQVAWTIPLPFGTYHFLAVSTPDNSGKPFSLTKPWGDYAGLDTTELAKLNTDLQAAKTDNLSLVFGHHPVTATGDSSDTYLYYGARDFVTALDNNGVVAYNYGHAHDNVDNIFKGDSYTGLMLGLGLRYRRVASLGKSGGDVYSVVSVDCNGVNVVTQALGTWPLVIITAPVSRSVGATANPYAYDVVSDTANPVRALVFPQGYASAVQFRIDGAGSWYPMAATIGTPQWIGTWDSSAVPAGRHTIEVQAVGSAVRSHSVEINLVSNVQPAKDNVTITTATYTKRTKTLLVKAISDGTPPPTLTVVGFGDMRYDATTKSYSYSKKLGSAPANVTVTSTLGGTASAAVKVV